MFLYTRYYDSAIASVNRVGTSQYLSPAQHDRDLRNWTSREIAGVIQFLRQDVTETEVLQWQIGIAGANDAIPTPFDLTRNVLQATIGGPVQHMLSGCRIDNIRHPDTVIAVLLLPVTQCEHVCFTSQK